MKVKLIWFILNLAILAYGIYLRSIAPDGAIVFVYLEYLITFPLGFFAQVVSPFTTIVAIPIILIIKLFNVSDPMIEDIIVPWFAFVLLGYIQWFILIPKTKKWWKDRKE